MKVPLAFREAIAIDGDANRPCEMSDVAPLREIFSSEIEGMNNALSRGFRLDEILRGARGRDLLRWRGCFPYHRIRCPSCLRYFVTSCRRKYCKPDCRASVKARADKRVSSPCIICGEECTGRCCSPACYSKRKHAKKKAERIASINPQTCDVCGSRFEADRRRSYCSRACSRKKHSNNIKERRRTDPEFRKHQNELAKKRLRERGLSTVAQKNRKAYQKRYRKTATAKAKNRAARSRRRAKLRDALHPDHNPLIEEHKHKLARRLERLTGYKWSVDHIVPIAKGGWHHHDNLQVIPNEWNCKKQENPYWRPEPCPAWFKVPTIEEILDGGIPKNKQGKD